MLLRFAHSYKRAFSGLSRESWLLGGVILINRAATMVAPFLGMYLTQRLGRSIAEAGMVVTLFGVGSLLGSLAAGYFIDRIGFRAVQIFTSLVGGLLFMLYGQITDFVSICILTVVLAFVAEAFRPANFTAVAAYAAEGELTRSYSLNRLAMNIGWGFGIMMAGVLADIDYHLLFWVEGIAYVLISILITVLLPAPRARTDKPKATDRTTVGSPWKDAGLLRFLAILLVYCASFILLFRLVPVYWKENLHLNETLIGVLLGLNGIIIALLEMMLVRYWEGRHHGLYYILRGVLLTAAGFVFLVLPLGMPVVTATISVVLITFGEMMALPFINTLVISRANEHNRGRYSSAYAVTWAIAQIIGPGGGGLVIERWGFVALWIGVAFLCIFCAWGIQVLYRRER